MAQATYYNGGKPSVFHWFGHLRDIDCDACVEGMRAYQQWCNDEAWREALCMPRREQKAWRELLGLGPPKEGK